MPLDREPPPAQAAFSDAAGSTSTERLAAALRRCQESLERAEQANGHVVTQALAANEQAAQRERTLRMEIERLESERAALQAQLTSLLASTSWRLTAPLRAAVTRVKRLSRRS